MNTLDDGRKLEYCCPQCLASIHRLDTDRTPRCARCGIRMEADSDEPVRRPQTAARLATIARRKAELVAPHPATGRPTGRPRSSGGKPVAAA